MAEAFGVQTVLGAFVAGVLIGESPILTGHIGSQLRGMVAAFFAPLFFALAGLNADLTVLKSPVALALTAALVFAASLGKFLGAFLGGAFGRLTRAESLALAIGMNARGSTEVIVASVGLSVGALTSNLYAMIVAMAVLTTSAMPPTLRWALARLPFRPGERERLEREAFEANGFVANIERFLIAASDDSNGRLALRLVGLLAGAPGRPTTVLHVEPRAAGRALANELRRRAAADVKRGAERAREARPEEAAGAPAVAVRAGGEPKTLPEALQDEAPKGYDFLLIGLDNAEARDGGFHVEIAEMARAFGGPLAVAITRGELARDPVAAPLRILAPISGARSGQRGAETAIELARAVRAELTILLVAGPREPETQRRRTLLSRDEQAALK
jgi:hypothetical protein